MHEILEADADGTLRPVTEYRSLRPLGWWRRNFTLGNILVIGSMVFAGLAASGRLVRSSELTDVELSNKVAVLESSLSRVEGQVMTRETLNAKLDAILVQITGVDKRLERVEQHLMTGEVRR